ncbi:MAG TPA: thiamine-phosphate kinase [Gemmatimonadaceae bacterium]|nr:thiamine-phosphate kinase [Gemmatimonadaceae bacterium]
MSDAVPLGPGAEFDAIRLMLDRWGPRATGIGDDAAVLRIARGDALVASVDTTVESRHFVRGWLTPREIGRRAVVAALSDLAAMAAHPSGVLISLIVPEIWRAELLELADGFGDAVTEAGTCIVGGNLSAGSELSITTTVLGHAYAPLTRAGARAGDRVYVTGRLGGPADALHRLRDGADAGPHRERFARPAARIAEAGWLAARGASAAIDISDGLSADARHLAAASGVCIALDARAIPCADGVAPELALESGEEYELLLTSPEPLDTADFEARFGIPLTAIGAVEAGDGVRVIGARVAAPSGHDHFSR